MAKRYVPIGVEDADKCQALANAGLLYWRAAAEWHQYTPDGVCASAFSLAAWVAEIRQQSHAILVDDDED